MNALFSDISALWTNASCECPDMSNVGTRDVAGSPASPNRVRRAPRIAMSLRVPLSPSLAVKNRSKTRSIFCAAMPTSVSVTPA